jgi:hypothetical protein
MICKVKGGLLLMHDNRPTTASPLDRLIRSILASNHSIVTPEQIEVKWDDQTCINRTRKSTQLIQQRAFNFQKLVLVGNKSASSFRPVEVSFPTHEKQWKFLRGIDPVARYYGKIKVSSNINDLKWTSFSSPSPNIKDDKKCNSFQF